MRQTKARWQSPMWMRRRDTHLVNEYHKLRMTGEKHSEAVKEVVKQLRVANLQMPISEAK